MECPPSRIRPRPALGRSAAAHRRERLRRRPPARAPGAGRPAHPLHEPAPRADGRAHGPDHRGGGGRRAGPGLAAPRRSRASTPPTTWCTRWAAAPTTARPTGPAPRPSAPPRATPGCGGSSTSGASASGADLSGHLASRQEVGRDPGRLGRPHHRAARGHRDRLGQHSFEMIRALVDRLPVMIMPALGRHPHPADRHRGRPRVPAARPPTSRSRAAASSRSAGRTRSPTAT